jgi:hypothetical protein
MWSPATGNGTAGGNANAASTDPTARESVQSRRASGSRGHRATDTRMSVAPDLSAALRQAGIGPALEDRALQNALIRATEARRCVRLDGRSCRLGRDAGFAGTARVLRLDAGGSAGVVPRVADGQGDRAPDGSCLGI